METAKENSREDRGACQRMSRERSVTEKIPRATESIILDISRMVRKN
jgi:hypothetical protein